MTTNTTTTPTAAKGREARRKTIFSFIGITLLLSFLVFGFAQGAGNSIEPVYNSINDDRLSKHYVECYSDSGLSGTAIVECPFEGEYGFDIEKDLEACAPYYKFGANYARPLTQCGFPS